MANDELVFLLRLTLRGCYDISYTREVIIKNSCIFFLDFNILIGIFLS